MIILACPLIYSLLSYSQTHRSQRPNALFDGLRRRYTSGIATVLGYLVNSLALLLCAAIMFFGARQGLNAFHDGVTPLIIPFAGVIIFFYLLVARYILHYFRRQAKHGQSDAEFDRRRRY